MLKPSLLEGLFIILGKIYWISTLPQLNTNFIIPNVNFFYDDHCEGIKEKT